MTGKPAPKIDARLAAALIALAFVLGLLLPVATPFGPKVTLHPNWAGTWFTRTCRDDGNEFTWQLSFYQVGGEARGRYAKIAGSASLNDGGSFVVQEVSETAISGQWWVEGAEAGADRQFSFTMQPGGVSFEGPYSDAGSGPHIWRGTRAPGQASCS